MDTFHFFNHLSSKYKMQLVFMIWFLFICSFSLPEESSSHLLRFVRRKSSNFFHSVVKFIPQLHNFKKIPKIVISRKGDAPISDFFIFLLSFMVGPASASPLNVQSIKIRGPFFQGWLVRNVDHVQNCSFILIVGSFSRKNSGSYDEHYVFCCVSTDQYTRSVEQFPLPSTVSIKKVGVGIDDRSAINIHWNAKGLGCFTFTENECSGCFNFDSKYFNIKFNATSRIRWKQSGDRKITEYNTSISKAMNPEGSIRHGVRSSDRGDGPEGWLGYTPLLPCHYFVHSVGSSCSYNIQSQGIKSHDEVVSLDRVSGSGFAHIEGNHGTFFPEGWTWCQAISPFNEASLSFVGGKFEIAGLNPINFVVFFRRKNGQRVVFRTTDLDRIQYSINPSMGVVRIIASSRNIFREEKLDIHVSSNIPSQLHFGSAVYIPTADGFSNQPGCVETYTATATIKYYANRSQLEPEVYSIPLTALEFGGSFVGKNSIT